MKLDERWNRREFIAVVADATVFSALGIALPAFSCEPARSVTFFDPRFPESRILALRMADAESLVRISGDATALVLQYAGTSSTAQSTRLQGVTTESVPFCLRQLRPGAWLNQHRVSRDLFTWVIEDRHG